MTRRARRNIVEEVTAELCVYGGLLATRIEVYADLRAILESQACFDQTFLDRLVWACPKAEAEHAALLRARGLTLKEERARESKRNSAPHK